MRSIQGWERSTLQTGINHLSVAVSEQLIHCLTSYIQTLPVFLLLLLLVKRMIVPGEGHTSGLKGR